MEKRMKIFEVEPEGYKALVGLEIYVNKTELTHTHKELIKIRTSQINGCAFCLDMHTKDARKYGETEQRIYTLNAWRDTPFFTPEEQALLALAEEVAQISGHVKDETFKRAVELLGEKYVAQAIILMVAINSWNRIAISTGMMPA
ncbi:carboxymuconolactone decarboxylase family protein [Flavobacterium sp. J372]|uniref:carboxymuconolactone decarboxylase family protein n=1 Tax=Flavobacterium sp. J372 TaxID=2898436 RepID=UPI0021514751|nr:carboxymuconolactone decarboxylase family protein [Flavobacterium sp. J372]MCR5860800.1 carboxymuconolactone decarboxylase family protein [Flavobacterium sp. J372]